MKLQIKTTLLRKRYFLLYKFITQIREYWPEEIAS